MHEFPKFGLLLSRALVVGLNGTIVFIDDRIQN